MSATPAVDGNTVYVPDWAGNLFAVDRKSGGRVWSHRISQYTGVAGDIARATPAVAGNKLTFGDQGGRVLAGARVIAVDKQGGDLLWVTRVESHFAAVVTQSAVMSSDNTVVYVVVSSLEELAAGVVPGYVCCSFRGSVLALDPGTPTDSLEAPHRPARLQRRVCLGQYAGRRHGAEEPLCRHRVQQLGSAGGDRLRRRCRGRS